MARSERGASLSTFVVVLLPALLLMIGLVIDGGAQAAATRRAERIAAAAARAAGDQTAAARLAGQEPDRGAAVAAAQRVIAEGGVSGSVLIGPEHITVNTRTSAPTVLLSLIGVGELPAAGSAVAELVPDR